jgi:hypothetical protein
MKRTILVVAALMTLLAPTSHAFEMGLPLNITGRVQIVGLPDDAQINRQASTLTLIGLRVWGVGNIGSPIEDVALTGALRASFSFGMVSYPGPAYYPLLDPQSISRINSAELGASIRTDNRGLFKGKKAVSVCLDGHIPMRISFPPSPFDARLSPGSDCSNGTVVINVEHVDEAPVVPPPSVNPPPNPGPGAGGGRDGYPRIIAYPGGGLALDPGGHH